jgi:very-short-patch-repair endonuclease
MKRGAGVRRAWQNLSAEKKAERCEAVRIAWANGKLSVPYAHRNTTLAQALHQHLSAQSLTLECEVRFGRFTVDLYDREHHVGYEADGMYWHDRHEAKHPGYRTMRDEYLIVNHGLKVVHYTDKEISALTGWPKKLGVAA